MTTKMWTVSYNRNYKDADGATVHAVHGWNMLSDTFVLLCGEREKGEYRSDAWTADIVTCFCCLARMT